MGSDIRLTVEDIFQTVCELAPEDRAAYLDRACSDNQDLRREVEELLNFYDSGETFLEKPALQDAARNLANQISNSAARIEIDADTLSEGGWMLGPYRILDQLGKGGMGVVYLAEDTRDEKRVALKALHKEFDLDEDRLARFSREGRMLDELKRLKHPNIAELYEQTEYDGKPCIVLEYVPGETLAERLVNGPLPVGEALQIALQVADALASAHRQKIVHRDLKPANIKITPDGVVKVLDFGLAKRFYPDYTDEDADEFRTRSVSLTESGMLMGTPAYMSPEQWEGKKIDQRVDIWAFGCLLYEMLAGRPPFAARTRAETMKASLHEDADWRALPGGTPLAVQDLLRRCLAKRAEQRLADAAHLQQVLAECIEKNSFALLPFLKSVTTWRINRKAARAVAFVILVLASSLALSRLWSVGHEDLATMIQNNFRGADKNLIVAVLTQQKQSAADLLQEKGRELRDNQNYRQGIDRIIGELKAGIEESGESAEALALLSQCYLFRYYLSRDDPDKAEAIKAVNKARSLNPEKLQSQIALGHVLLSVGLIGESVEIFEKARANAERQDDADALLGLAIAYDIDGRIEKAEESYKKAIDKRFEQTANRDWGDYYELGYFYFLQGKYDLAAKNWREVVAIDPLNAHGYNMLGSALLFEGCVDQATDAYNKSLAIRETPEALASRGTAYFISNIYPHAIEDFRRATVAGQGAIEETKHITPWANLGDGYRMAGQTSEAIEAYTRALAYLEEHLRRAMDDHSAIALKAEIVAKLKSLGRRQGEDPIALVEKSLANADCLNCMASAAVVFHLEGKDVEAADAARQAVESGYSAFVLTRNPELAGLKNKPKFQQLAAIAPPGCR
jgi:serine/threonine protein kinase/Tfp pilus assembly protein PilF